MNRQDILDLFPLKHPMLSVAVEAVQRGSDKLRQHFQTSLQIESKGLANFVTEADLASEQVLVETIRGAFSGHAFISEESHADRAEEEHLWIIDPLDGTSNFMHGIPHFAISMAYCHNGQTELAIVCNPIHLDWYIAVRGQGAWLNGVRQHVDPATSIDQALICCGFYYDRGLMMQATLDALGDFFRSNIHGVRRFGAAALDLCNVGCGQYGLFFEFKLHLWDLAAGVLFLNEAGGHATNCDGESLSLQKTNSMCATNGHLHQQALNIITPHWARWRASMT